MQRSPASFFMPHPNQWHDDPSPEQIRKLCEQIQAGWSEAERRKRSHFQVDPITAEIVPAEVFYGESDRGE